MKTKMQMRFEYLVNEIIKAEPFITARVHIPVKLNMFSGID